MSESSEPATEGFVQKLRRELWDWQGFGELPGSDKLQLYFERIDLARVETCDLVFLLLGLALDLGDRDDTDEDRRTDVELSMDSLTELLFARATDGESVVGAGLRDGRLRPATHAGRTSMWFGLLEDGETNVLFGRLRTVPEDTRVIFGQISVRSDVAVEVLAFQDGTCAVVRYGDGRSRAAEIVRLATEPDASV